MLLVLLLTVVLVWAAGASSLCRGGCSGAKDLLLPAVAYRAAMIWSAAESNRGLQRATVIWGTRTIQRASIIWGIAAVHAQTFPVPLPVADY